MNILEIQNNKIELQTLFEVPDLKKPCFSWYDENGNSLDYLTEDDVNPTLEPDGTYKGVKVIKKQVTWPDDRFELNKLRYYPRYANSENDFQYILDRELNRGAVPISKSFIANHIISIERKIRRLRDLHENEWDLKLFDIAEKYLDFLKSYPSKMKRESNIPEAEKIEFDLQPILDKLKFDRYDESKPAFKECLKSLSSDKRFLESKSGKEISTIASIFYKTNWLRVEHFSEWVKLFYQIFSINLTKYKQNQVEHKINAVQAKFPYLEQLPKYKK